MSCNNPFFFKRNGIIYTLPCNYCQGCRKDKINEWTDRIRFEKQSFAKKGFYSSFVTLTYNDGSLPEDRSVSLRDIQLFNKKLRKHLSSLGRPYKYYISSEYGTDNFRPHYHCVLLGISPDEERLIRQTWNKGFIDIKPLTIPSIRYVLKYINSESRGKQLEDIYTNSGVKPPFVVMSQGIGRQYLLENMDSIKENYGYYKQGHFVKIPKYYKDILGIKTPLSVDLTEKYMKAAKENGYDDVMEYLNYLRSVRERDLITKSRNKLVPVSDFKLEKKRRKLNLASLVEF